MNDNDGKKKIVIKRVACWLVKPLPLSRLPYFTFTGGGGGRGSYVAEFRSYVFGCS